MNKKTLGTLVLAMTVGAALLPMSADAATESQTGASIGFNSGPDTPLPGPYDNSLSLVNRPTAFNFGKTNEVSALTQTFNQELKGEQHIGVFEDRSDDLGAWAVNASFSDLVDSEGTPLISSLSFNSEKMKSFDIERNAEGELPTEIASLGTLTPYTAGKVTGVKRVELKAGGDSATIMTAKADAGKGGFASQIRNVQLSVKGGQEALMTSSKSFTGAITWSIDDTI